MLGKFRKGSKGFTLIELMIVIAIIGILVAIAVPQFNAYRARGWMAATRSDARNAFTAVAARIADRPGEDLPALTLGPGPAQVAAGNDYAGLAASTGVTINISAGPANGGGGDVTTQHNQLGGTFVMRQDGTITDTLTP